MIRTKREKAVEEFMHKYCKTSKDYEEMQYPNLELDTIKTYIPFVERCTVDYYVAKVTSVANEFMSILYRPVVVGSLEKYNLYQSNINYILEEIFKMKIEFEEFRLNNIDGDIGFAMIETDDTQIEFIINKVKTIFIIINIDFISFRYLMAWFKSKCYNIKNNLKYYINYKNLDDRFKEYADKIILETEARINDIIIGTLFPRNAKRYNKRVYFRPEDRLLEDLEAGKYRGPIDDLERRKCRQAKQQKLAQQMIWFD